MNEDIKTFMIVSIVIVIGAIFIVGNYVYHQKEISEKDLEIQELKNIETQKQMNATQYWKGYNKCSAEVNDYFEGLEAR